MKLSNMEEYVECSKSIDYFKNRYIIIDHPTNGTMQYWIGDMYSNHLNRCVFNTHKLIFSAPRQSGKSTLCLIKLLHEFIFSINADIIHISHKYALSDSNIRRFLRMHDHLPEFLKGDIHKSGRTLTNIKTDTKLSFLSNKATNRGLNIPDLLVIDNDMPSIEVDSDLDFYIFNPNTEVFITTLFPKTNDDKYKSFEYYRLNVQDLNRYSDDYIQEIKGLIGLQNFRQQYG